MGLGIKGISSTFGISRNTVRKYVRKYQESGLPLDKLLSMSAERVDEIFRSNLTRERAASPRREALEALLPDYAKRLDHKGTLVKDLFAEYSASHPAGDQMYVDFAGDKLEVTDAETGEVHSVEVFVAILPCSHYTYCEAVWSQKKDDFILACENAIRFCGGAPMAIVPDNLKSAVIKSDRNESVINEEFAAFAEFYNCAVYPARVRHPKDKALVENAVKLMYRSVYEDLKGQVFHDLASLNEAMLKSLEVFNRRKLTGRKESRKELFEEVEKDNIGKRVDIIYDADTLEIFYVLKLF